MQARHVPVKPNFSQADVIGRGSARACRRLKLPPNRQRIVTVQQRELPMRSLLFAVAAGSALSLTSLAALADDQPRMQPAGYDPSTQMICMYQVHDGIMIKRPICRTAHGWATEKEYNRQVFRQFQMRSLVQHR
jgi:hypothetical protein